MFRVFVHNHLSLPGLRKWDNHCHTKNMATHVRQVTGISSPGNRVLSDQMRLIGHIIRHVKNSSIFIGSAEIGPGYRRSSVPGCAL